MNLPRSIIRDLIDRRLWPIALVLAIALAAVPVLLGRHGDATTTPPAAPAAPAATADDTQKAEVTLDTSTPAERARVGHLRNPFKGIAATTTTTTTTTVPSPASPADAGSASGTASDGSATSGADTGSAGSGGTSGDSSPSSGSGSSGSSDSGSTGSSGSSGSTGSGSTGSSKSKPKTTTPKAADVTDTYHVSLRITVDGGKTTTVRDIARLSPLPSVTDPFFVYLGVLQTTGKNPEKRAVFVVSSDATPNGEGACHPTKQDCETVELTVGQTAFFDYTAPGGKVTQYELELAGIHKTAVKVQAKAAAAFARHSVAGSEILRDAAVHNVRAAGGARAYRYLPAVGLLVRAKRAKVTAKAAAAGEIPGIELVDRKHQPGIPVWHSPKK